MTQTRFPASTFQFLLEFFVTSFAGASYNGFLRRIFVTLSFSSCPVSARTDCFVAELKKLLDWFKLVNVFKREMEKISDRNNSIF